MRKMMLLVLLGLCVCCRISAQINEKFSDGELLHAPQWLGDTGSFFIADEMLHSNGPTVASQIYMSTPSLAMDEVEWDVLIHLDFNPSTVNQVRFYLCSNNVNLRAPLNGYFLLLGETGTNDSLQFIRQDGSSNVALLKGAIPAMSDAFHNTCRIKIIRHSDGRWDLYQDATGGRLFTAIGAVYDNTYRSSAFLGLRCDYSTVSRSTMYAFDDIYAGNVIRDTTPPNVQSFELLGEDKVGISFDELIDTNEAKVLSHFSSTDTGLSITQVSIDSLQKQKIWVQFSRALIHGHLTELIISGMKDWYGNERTLDVLNLYIPALADVVFSEIMSNPDASGDIPTEFIELYNRSDIPIALQGFSLYDAAAQTGTPAIFQPMLFPAKSYLICCNMADTALFSAYGRVLGLAHFPSLNNSGDELTLIDNHGQSIDRVAYQSDWYGKESSKGRSLERIDVNTPCSTDANWKASTDSSGATPGKMNSVGGIFVDDRPFKAKRLSYLNDNTLMLELNKSVQLTALNNAAFDISPNSMWPLAYQQANQARTHWRIQLPFSMLADSIYYLHIKALKDCPGREIEPVRMPFGKPALPAPGDLVLNEILFNPYSGSSDFVEVLNTSNKILDLHEVQIEERSPDDSSLLGASYLGDSLLQCLPGQYLACTEQVASILSHYPVADTGTLQEVPGLPNFDDMEDIVALVNKRTMLDVLHYNHRWHFALLNDENGVSLERLDPTGITQSSANWHSAASANAYATPGYQNSQYNPGMSAMNDLEIEPEIFSPDQDGRDDILLIRYHNAIAGTLLNLTVLDLNGQLIKRIAHNEIGATSGLYTWDGINEQGALAAVGPYLLAADFLDLNGKKFQIRKKMILAQKLR